MLFKISNTMIQSTYEWADKRHDFLTQIRNLNRYYADAHVLLKNIDKLVRELTILNVEYRNRVTPTIKQKEKLSEINNAIDILEKWLLVITLTE